MKIAPNTLPNSEQIAESETEIRKLSWRKACLLSFLPTSAYHGLILKPVPDFGHLHGTYRGTSLLRNNPSLGCYSRLMPRALWWSYGGVVSYERGTLVPASATESPASHPPMCRDALSMSTLRLLATILFLFSPPTCPLALSSLPSPLSPAPRWAS